VGRLALRIVLAQSPDFFPSAFKLAPPTSLLYLGAVLEKAGYGGIHIIDPIVENMSDKAFINAVVKDGPDVFGMYVTSDTYFTAAKAIGAIKRRMPHVTTIAGGPHPTLLAGHMLQALPELDIVVRGEGENVLPVIVDRLESDASLTGIPNTSFRDGDRIVHNKQTDIVKDLDAVPFPAFHLIDLDKYQYSYPVIGKGEVKAINLITSRGCPFNCLFCANTNLFENIVRFRSIPNVVEEIQSRIDDYHVGYFWIQDDSFNLSPRRILEFCEYLIKERVDINWSCIMRADRTSRELLSTMKKSGFVGGYFAVETISDYLRQTVIGKKLSMDDVHRSIALFNELNLVCGINFIVSLPDETKQDMEKDISFIEDLRLVHLNSSVNLNVLRIYPGTRLEVEARRRGVLREGFSWFDRERMQKYSPGTLPGLYGVVPLYKEHLSFVDIFVCLFRWKYSPNFSVDPGKSGGLLRYLAIYVRNMKSARDIFLLAQIAWAWIKVAKLKLSRLLGNVID